MIQVVVIEAGQEILQRRLMLMLVVPSLSVVVEKSIEWFQEEAR